MTTIKDRSKREARFTNGHRACAGCGFPPMIRMVLDSCNGPVVIGASTGCLEVTTTLFPYSSWRVPFIHTAFENVAATISGAEAAYRSLRTQGMISKDIRFIAFGGDGGTYDIGLQSLSGAVERGHRMLYICYDNGGYANTGVQRSSSTPRGASTTTSPYGQSSYGKPQRRKDLTAIMISHHIPYAAQAAVGHWNDLCTKVEKALAVDGPSFINVMTPCRLIWGTVPEDTMDLTRHAVDTCFWPLYEAEHGKIQITFTPREKRPLDEWLKRQVRFKHLFKPENASILHELQVDVDLAWKRLQDSVQSKS